MGFLQKIFGKKETAPVDTGFHPAAAPPPLRTVYPVDDVPAWKKEVAEPAAPEIYPVLVAGNDEILKSGILYETLIGTAENPQLAVAFRNNTASPADFLKADALDGKTPEARIQEALKNLEKVAVSFEKVPVENGFLLTVSGPEFASEKVLSPAFLKEAQELLQSEELLISVPRRSQVLIAPRPASPEIHEAFLTLHDTMWQDENAAHPRVLNAALVIADGEIEAMIPLD